MKNLIAVCLFLAISALAGEQSSYSKGLVLLQESQTDHSKLVPAVKLLALAAEEFDKSGDQEKAIAANSCLYWAKKRMTIQDIDILRPEAAYAKIDPPSIPVSQSKAMLENADKFAKAHPTEHLVIAIQYFEVADRFPEVEEGKKALKASLSAMQNVKMNKAVVGVIDLEFEQGWSVYVDGKDTELSTPCSIDLPVGSHGLFLAKDGFTDISLSVQVKGYEKIEPKQKPTAGISKIKAFVASKQKELAKEIVGTWKGKHSAWQGPCEFKEDGSFKQLSGSKLEGKWKYNGKTLSLSWNEYPREDLVKLDKNTFTGDKLVLKR